MFNVLNHEEYCKKATLDQILSGEIEGLKGFKIVISHEPGSQRLVNLEKNAIKRKISGYEKSSEKIKSIPLLKEYLNMKEEEVLNMYRYDMQGMLVYIDYANKVICVIDGQQRLTLQFVLKMYINLYAFKNKDFSLSKSVQKEAGVNVNNNFTFINSNFSIKTLNSFEIQIENEEGEFSSKKISDFQQMIRLYNLTIQEYSNIENFSTKDFLKSMENKLKNSSMYLDYFSIVVSELEESNLNYIDLHKASKTIRVTVDSKSPWESIEEALIRVGVKPASMNASTFCLSSMFESIRENDFDSTSFCNIYNNIMTRKNNIESINDFLFQILVSKHDNSGFISKSLESNKNIFYSIQEIVKKTSGLDLMKEFESISDLYFDLEKRDISKVLNINLFKKIKKETYELLLGLDRLLNEHSLDEKTFFILIPLVLKLNEYYEYNGNISKNLLIKIEKFVRTINLYLFAKKENINNLKSEESYFFYISGLIQNINIVNSMSFSSAMNLDNLKDIQLNVFQIINIIESMETTGWSGSRKSNKSFLREAMLGNAERIKEDTNVDFLTHYSNLQEVLTVKEIIINRYFGKGNDSEEYDHFLPIHDKKTNLQEEFDIKKTINTLLSKRDNRNRRKENKVEKISEDKYTSNEIYYSTSTGLLTKRAEDTRKLHSYLKVEKLKDFIFRNLDIIVVEKDFNYTLNEDKIIVNGNLDSSINRKFLPN